jgi:hypothetical protein
MTIKACGGRNPRLSVDDDFIAKAVSYQKGGMSLHECARKMDRNVDVVARAVRRIIPNAFRRQTSKIDMKPMSGTVHRVMPHQVGWSTDPVSHHAISLPRLKCLEAA